MYGISSLFDRSQGPRRELLEEFPGRLLALASLLGMTHQAMQEALGASRSQYRRYRIGERIPAGAQMLTLVRLARTAEGGLDILDGSTDEAVEIAFKAQRVAERRRARRAGNQGLSVESAGETRVDGFVRRILRSGTPHGTS